MGLITFNSGLGPGQLESVLSNLNSVPLKDCHLVKVICLFTSKDLLINLVINHNSWEIQVLKVHWI
jgi:hypothetical protein